MVRVVDDIIEHPDGFTDLSDARSAFRDRMQFFGIFMFFVIMKVSYSYEAHNHTTLTVKDKKLVNRLPTQRSTSTAMAGPLVEQFMSGFGCVGVDK